MNKILIEGRLGKDAETRETKGGKMLTMTVAENQFDGKEKVTVWYDVTSFNFNEKLVQYYKKGSSVFVTGTLKPREETGKDGTKYNRLRVTAVDFDFPMPSKADSEGKTETQETTNGAVSNNKGNEQIPEPVVTTASISNEDNSDLPF